MKNSCIGVLNVDEQSLLYWEQLEVEVVQSLFYVAQLISDVMFAQK